MFCDLVGSTSLAAKLDAEDWRNLVNTYLDETCEAVIELGGHVLKKLGDGLMALFGYPETGPRIGRGRDREATRRHPWRSPHGPIGQTIGGANVSSHEVSD
jgi:class 3 adenylate cyclase